MTWQRFLWMGVVLLACCGTAAAQSPGILYTWPGTGDVAEWSAQSSTNTVTVTNSTAGSLTAVELGLYDPINEITINGGAFTLRDGFNRRREQNTQQGGLDLTGLSTIELDVMHNGAANINVQFYMQTTPSYTYLWGGSDAGNTLNGPDWTIAPNTLTTVKFPISALNSAQQAWISAFGLSVREHAAAGNATWTITEVRSTGTPLTVRTLAPHDVGSSDNGLNGAYVNFDRGAVVGNDGGQNQTGLSFNPAGSGSLQWTDKGGDGTAANPSGAAITWVNGTAFTNNNSFYERLADFSNYNRLTIRMKATDVTPGGGGSIGVQGFFHTDAYAFTVAGGTGFANLLPVDGQYYDLVYSITNVPDLADVQDFGVNLFSHPNDVTIDVDYVRFSTVAGVPGDYNNNGIVDGADYVLWRNGGPLQNEVDTPGTVNEADYAAWRARFGNTTGSGAVLAAAVPEPTGLVLLVTALVCGLLGARPRG